MKRFFIVLFVMIPILSFSWDFRQPMDSYIISSTLGSRMNPLGGSNHQFHQGVDLVGEHNCIIYSIEKGVVVRIEGDHPIFGKMVIIKHDGGIYSLYAHLSVIFVYLNDPVERGNWIGRQGATGIATGEHLHFEIFFDPLEMIDQHIALLKLSRYNSTEVEDERQEGSN